MNEMARNKLCEVEDFSTDDLARIIRQRRWRPIDRQPARASFARALLGRIRGMLVRDLPQHPPSTGNLA